MPNWCNNQVTFSGTTEDINNIIEFVEGDMDLVDGSLIVEPFSLDAIIPMPADLLVGDGWYGWRNENWGTKWDATNGDMFDDSKEGFVSYSFDTAWSPPEPIYNALKEKYPEVRISWFYDEPGMGFSGYLPD
jgi:hypothetical protein